MKTRYHMRTRSYFLFILIPILVLLSCGGMGISSDITQVDETCNIISEDASDWIGCSPACPNPATQVTIFRYLISQASFIEIKIFGRGFSDGSIEDLIINLVSTNKSVGLHSVAWNLKDSNGRDLGNGLYRVRFFADGELFCEGDIQILR